MVVPRRFRVLGHPRNECRKMREDKRELEQPPVDHSAGLSRLFKCAVKELPCAVRQRLSAAGLYTEALKCLLQKINSKPNPIGFARIARNVPVEPFFFSLGMLFVLNACGRVKIILLVSYPTTVSIDERA